MTDMSDDMIHECDPDNPCELDEDGCVDDACTCYEDDLDGESYEDPVWADADALASAGWGTDEDYGYFGGDDY